MLPHHWASVVSNSFRRANQLENDDRLVGEPALISDMLLFDEGSGPQGVEELGRLGLKLYSPTMEEVLAGDFSALAVHVTMADDPRSDSSDSR